MRSSKSVLILSAACLFAAAAMVGWARRQSTYDLVIRNGSVIDGSGAPARSADIAIRGDTIAEVGNLAGAQAPRVIDAAGLTVAPGFIDMHSHSDFSLLVDGRAMSKVTQGVTTELLGESESAAPVLGAARPELEAALATLRLQADWTTLEEYFARLERQRMSVNIASMVAAGTVRTAVIGLDNRPATPAELARMATLVEEGMRHGAAGLSSGLIYPPNSYASTDELIALARVAAKDGGIYLSHIRGEGEDLLTAIGEAIRIGREANIPVEVLHFKRSGIRLHPSGERSTIREAAALIEKAQQQGVRIYADVYPYAASSTTLNTRLPDWTTEGGAERLTERLRDPVTRRKIHREVEASFGRGIAGSTPGTIMLSRTPYEPHRRFQGKRFDVIAREMGKGETEAFFEVIERAGGRAGGIFFSMREEDVEFALTLPWTTIGSDGSALAPEGILARTSPHPRSYGTFPRVLGRYVRDRKALTLPEAIRKMTGLPASRIGLADRGLLAPGKKADIAIFDAGAIVDRATFESPHQLSTGVRWLIVNGELVLANGQHTGAMPGRVLRHTGHRRSQRSPS